MSTGVLERNGAELATIAAVPSSRASSPSMTLNEVWQMAEYIAASGLFAAKTPQQAFALFMLAQCEGLHPMEAMKQYHIIEGRPSMRSDAIQAKFLAHGGRIEILVSDDVQARAIFSHPTLQPKGFDMKVTYADFEAVGLTLGKFDEKTRKREVKTNWKVHRADMLWARLVTKAVRKIDPGVIVGIYSSEEVQDAIDLDSPLVQTALANVQSAKVVAAAQAYVLGQPEGFDTRAYHEVVTDAVKASGVASLTAPLTHKYLINEAIQTCHSTVAPPSSTKPAIEAMTKVYKNDPDWVRLTLMAHLASLGSAPALGALGATKAQAEPETAADDPDDADGVLDAAFDGESQGELYEPGADG